ncbi:Protein NRT1/ PTR FAMILY 5.10 [Striga hermonthica]|uniref:Protein NRT1/ PTR FAMILY 5.10 n=1 Tax=Striga hermonthica TaxID=68872 RepID=A0A9N7R2D8_STRHE|nr:Protein NRT1/ PTR FAMILY 5.10 [Striga hermonthica]
MTIGAREEISAAEVPLLNDVVPRSVDFRGRPSVRSKSGCWKSASFIIGAGVAERLSYYGISVNLVNYLTGKLGQPTATAASVLNAWYGTASLLPILGAFLADSFSGRFRMIIASCVLYVSGLSFLSLSAALRSADASKCKPAANYTASCTPDHLQLTFFFFALYLVAIAQGGLTPCVQAFGADQFDEDDEDESESKSSFFNWWYCFSSGVIVVPLFGLTYIQDNVSWELGFGIPAVVMCLTLVVFLVGCPTYRFRVNPGGMNPFVRITLVFVKAVRNWRAHPGPELCEEEGVLPRTGSQFRFLDKALLTRDGWAEDDKVCSVGDVEDARSILRLIPIWFACLGYSIVYAQPATLFTKQIATIDRRVTPSFEMPAASIQLCFITAVVMVCLPLYDRALVPLARKITKTPSGIPTLGRISFGLLLSLSSIVIAALVERRRLSTASQAGLPAGAVVPMSVWWFAPQYVLSGIADVFAMVGLQEFFYGEVPAELKSVGLSMYLSILGIGSLLSSFLISSIQVATSRGGRPGWFADDLNRAHLDYFYWLLAGMSALGFVAFTCFTKSYMYKRTKVHS